MLRVGSLSVCLGIIDPTMRSSPAWLRPHVDNRFPCWCGCTKLVVDKDRVDEQDSRAGVFRRKESNMNDPIKRPDDGQPADTFSDRRSFIIGAASASILGATSMMPALAQSAGTATASPQDPQ